MVKKYGRRWLLTALIAVPLLAVGWLAFFYTEVGMANEIGEGARETHLTEDDYSTIPQSVIDDATVLAREMVGDSQDKLQDFVDQLLASYIKARESDVVVVFNSGGWGWNLLEDTPGWNSIVEGIKTELDEFGYRPLVLNYQRTSHTLRSCFKEFLELLSRSPSKGKELARRVDFLTSHLPEVKVIVAGESTGTVVTDSSMKILRDNPQVYSIQTGAPFWHKPNLCERTLLLNSNGKTIDTFSYGKVTAVLGATIKGMFGLMPTEENPGTILSWLRAPGHDYSWQYPRVCSEVTRFLEQNFKGKK
jgi:hypothetical protein